MGGRWFLGGCFPLSAASQGCVLCDLSRWSSLFPAGVEASFPCLWGRERKLMTPFSPEWGDGWEVNFPIVPCLLGEGGYHPQNSFSMKRNKEAARGEKGDPKGNRMSWGTSPVREKQRLFPALGVPNGHLRRHESERTWPSVQDRPWGLSVSYHF